MKFRMLALMTILAVTLTAAPAFAGHPFVPRHRVYRHVWTVPFDVPPPPPPVVHRYYRPPVYVAPRLLPGQLVPSPGYWIPSRHYYYDEPGLEIGVAGGGLGLHIEF
jgi:hypothetical protein